MLFSLLKHYLDTDTALKVSQSVYCFTTSISHGVSNYFPRLWGTGISDAIFISIEMQRQIGECFLYCISFQSQHYPVFICIMNSYVTPLFRLICENCHVYEYVI